MPMFRLFAVASLMLFAACGSGTDYGSPPPPPPPPPPPGPTPPPPPPPGLSVTVSNNRFDPATLNITAGQAVTWTWDAGGVTHNVTFADGTGNSGDKSSGTHSRTFSAAGTYNYECTLHGGMTGSIVAASQ